MERSKLCFAPRKPGTGWSGANKQRVEKLLAAELMTSAGLARVEAAKRDGSWQRLDAAEALEVPLTWRPSLPRCHRYFGGFPRSVKRGILEWILNAKRPATRSKRIEETALPAANNLRVNQGRK